jgi:hypothetical protein
MICSLKNSYILKSAGYLLMLALYIHQMHHNNEKSLVRLVGFKMCHKDQQNDAIQGRLAGRAAPQGPGSGHTDSIAAVYLAYVNMQCTSACIRLAILTSTTRCRHEANP